MEIVMPKISGLDEMKAQLDEIQSAVSKLDGQIGQVSFDPSNSESVENAISEVHQMIDSKVEGFTKNEIVRGVISEMKQKYADAIRQKAIEAKDTDD
ncbi:MAG: hypothetical protein AAFQ36_00165 [Pseudomonadota bacterium]